MPVMSSYLGSGAMEALQADNSSDTSDSSDDDDDNDDDNADDHSPCSGVVCGGGGSYHAGEARRKLWVQGCKANDWVI